MIKRLGVNVISWNSLEKSKDGTFSLLFRLIVQLLSNKNNISYNIPSTIFISKNKKRKRKKKSCTQVLVTKN